MAASKTQITLQYARLLAIHGELNKARGGLQLLEERLHGLLPKASREAPDLLENLKLIDITLKRIGHCFMGGDMTCERSVVAVEVMNLALDCWIEEIGKTKIELAKESRLWKVYANPDGWERTQTLDKYLELSTLPNNPRWKKIMATADFVLSNCEMPSPRREALESALVSLRISAG